MNTRYRLVFAAAALPAVQARIVIEAIAARNARLERRAAVYERTRSRLQTQFKKGFTRILNFAKHETLRKLHRYLHANRPLHGQAESDAAHPDAVKIGFSVDDLRQDLLKMLQSQLPDALQGVASDTLDSLGYRDPWTFPAQATLDMIAARQNLISGVPDEIFAEIQDQISDGLKAGESLSQLSDRVTKAFNQIIAERADLIAQTETAVAYGFASNEAADQAGVQYKQWIHAGDPKVPREDHLAIDGLIVPFDEPFPVGDPPLMYPYDPDGSPEDVLNCGCISIPATTEDYQNQ